VTVRRDAGPVKQPNSRPYGAAISRHLAEILRYDHAVSVISILPGVIRAEYRGAYRIHLTLNDGFESTVDFSRWLDGPVFEPLKAPAYFRRFFLEGGTVAWPNGADIAPETLYEQVRSSQSPTPASRWSRQPGVWGD
jgi:hypothetical protein